MSNCLGTVIGFLEIMNDEAPGNKRIEAMMTAANRMAVMINEKKTEIRGFFISDGDHDSTE